MNCNINGLTISTASDKEYSGGFIGMQKGAIVESCSVTGGTNTIGGKNFVGGFVGLARDDVIEGTLSGALDIETKLPKMNTESLLLNCSLNNAVASVSGEVILVVLPEDWPMHQLSIVMLNRIMHLL